MLRTVYYGPHTIQPWCPGTGYLDPSAKSLKSYRSREPQPIWQSLPAKTDDLGEYNLYICKYCFLYTSKQQDITIHEEVCRYKAAPPGKKIFQDSEYTIYEVQVPQDNDSPSHDESIMGVTPSGTEYNSLKLYLQSLSLFGHLFLETKSICFCVDEFLYYVAIDNKNGMAAGFFSKEKHSWHDYNLACIVIFPPWQRHGLGQRLIECSYKLAKGSPEKPLSKHGQQAYHRFWRRKFLGCIVKSPKRGRVSLESISNETGIEPSDIYAMLDSSGALDDRTTVNLKALMDSGKPKPAPAPASTENPST